MASNKESSTGAEFMKKAAGIALVIGALAVGWELVTDR